MIEMASRGLGLNIKITTQLDRSVPPLFVDPAGLESALLNLVVNARDAMPKGGSINISSLRLNLDDDNPALHAGYLKIGDCVCVSVSDTGQGMSRETLERACEPFYTTKANDKGTGLGLAMVYGFAKQSGGFLRIYSEPGLGTTVSFYLPIVADVAHAAPARVLKSDHASLDGTVLVVDDEADLIEVALVYLTDMGLNTFEATDGISALEMLAQHGEINLLITDIVMPGGMSGTELAQRARALYPTLKIIYSSGFPAEAVAEKTMPHVDGPILRKPYRFSEFGAAVRSVMGAANDKATALESSHSG
jgi:CheY-like chemotaxis protein